MRLYYQQAVALWPQTLLSPQITSSQAVSRPLMQPAKVSQPTSAPVRTKHPKQHHVNTTALNDLCESIYAHAIKEHFVQTRSLTKMHNKGLISYGLQVAAQTSQLPVVAWFLQITHQTTRTTPTATTP